jgi:hypothetical protein
VSVDEPLIEDWWEGNEPAGEDVRGREVAVARVVWRDEVGTVILAAFGP